MIHGIPLPASILYRHHRDDVATRQTRVFVTGPGTIIGVVKLINKHNNATTTNPMIKIQQKTNTTMKKCNNNYRGSGTTSNTTQKSRQKTSQKQDRNHGKKQVRNKPETTPKSRQEPRQKPRQKQDRNHVKNHAKNESETTSKNKSNVINIDVAFMTQKPRQKTSQKQIRNHAKMRTH